MAARDVEFALAMNHFMSVIRQTMNIPTNQLKENGSKEEDRHSNEDKSKTMGSSKS